jgi:hypothetical protein
MKISIGDLRELVGPQIRFSLTITDDSGDPLLTYPGWTLNVWREIQTPATRTSRGYYKRFSEISEPFERQLLNTLESFPEVDRVLGEKQLRVKSTKKKIVGEKTLQ